MTATTTYSLTIHGAPYDRDGEALGDCTTLAQAAQLAADNLATDSQRVDVRDIEGELVARYRLVDGACEEIEI